MLSDIVLRFGEKEFRFTARVGDQTFMTFDRNWCLKFAAAIEEEFGPLAPPKALDVLKDATIRRFRLALEDIVEATGFAATLSPGSATNTVRDMLEAIHNRAAAVLGKTEGQMAPEWLMKDAREIHNEFSKVLGNHYEPATTAKVETMSIPGLGACDVATPAAHPGSTATLPAVTVQSGLAAIRGLNGLTEAMTEALEDGSEAAFRVHLSKLYRATDALRLLFGSDMPKSHEPFGFGEAFTVAGDGKKAAAAHPVSTVKPFTEAEDAPARDCKGDATYLADCERQHIVTCPWYKECREKVDASLKVTLPDKPAFKVGDRVRVKGKARFSHSSRYDGMEGEIVDTAGPDYRVALAKHSELLWFGDAVLEPATLPNPNEPGHVADNAQMDTAPEANEPCEHAKVYKPISLSFVDDGDGYRSDWICQKCGEMGHDIIMVYREGHEYDRLVAKFHGEAKATVPPHRRDNPPPLGREFA